VYSPGENPFRPNVWVCALDSGVAVVSAIFEASYSVNIGNPTPAIKRRAYGHTSATAGHSTKSALDLEPRSRPSKNTEGVGVRPVAETVAPPCYFGVLPTVTAHGLTLPFRPVFMRLISL